MAEKEKKSAAELEALTLYEIRRYRECDHIMGVAITRPPQTAPHHPNWDAAFTISGNEIPPPIAFEIATRLKSQFDLA